MGAFSNFKIPDVAKIDKSMLPDLSGSDIGKEISAKVKDVGKNLNINNAFNANGIENPKTAIISAAKTVPQIANFNLMSLIPNSMLDKVDTDKIMGDLNNKFSGLNLQSLGFNGLTDGTINDISSAAKKILSGEELDFSSLYSMPAVPDFESQVGSEFNMDEMINEANTMVDIGTNDFDINKYLNDFGDLTI